MLKDPLPRPAPAWDEPGADPVDWEQRTIGDRLAAFSVLLPAVPAGPVVLASRPHLTGALSRRFPGAVVLRVRGAQTSPGTGRERLVAAEPTGARWTGVIEWDGRRSPLRPESVHVLITDDESVAALLRPALAPGAATAVLRGQGEYLLYPTSEHPEHVWRAGWPVPPLPGLLAQAKRIAGLRLRLRPSVPRLAVDTGKAASLADAVVADVASATGAPGRLVGVQAAGHTILRVRQPDGDLAVRLSVNYPDALTSTTPEIVAEVPALAPFLQQDLAAGTTDGVQWVATRWVPGRRSLLQVHREEARRWAAAERLAQVLATVSTGATAPGWAAAWVGKAVLLTPEQRRRFISVLEPAEQGLPTGWCHGDLWPANVLLGADGARVIDWANASADAPLGIDALLVVALRQARRRGGPVGEALAELGEAPERVPGAVAGRRYADWDPAHRQALAVAAFVLHLRNRAMHDIGEEDFGAEVASMLAAAGYRDDTAGDALDLSPDSSDGPTAADTDAELADGSAGRAARGALWLGASSLIVKGAQTVVLLVLAALLAPAALGLVAVGTMIVNFASTMTELGTSLALVYWRGDVQKAARTSVTIALGTSLTVTAAVWAIAPWLAAVLHVGSAGSDVIRGLTSVLPCYAIAAVTQELMRRRLQFLRRVVPDVISAIAGAGVAVALALDHHGVAALVVGQIVQGALTLVLAWLAGGIVVPGWNADDARGLLRYGGHLSGADFARLLLLNVDYVIVARVLGETQLGRYSLAYRLAYLPFLNVAFVICGAAFPYLCRLRGAAIGRAVERITHAAVTVLVPLCLGMALLADDVTLLGAKWAPAVPVVRWLALYAVLLSLSQIVQTALNSIGRPQGTFGLRLLHLAALIALLVVLAPHGIVAVGVGQVVAIAVATVPAVTMARRYLPGLNLGRLSRTLCPSVLGGAAMAVVVLAAQSVLPGRGVSVGGLLTCGLVGVLAYAGAVWCLDRAHLAQTLRVVGNR